MLASRGDLVGKTVMGQTLELTPENAREVQEGETLCRNIMYHEHLLLKELDEKMQGHFVRRMILGASAAIASVPELMGSALKAIGVALGILSHSPYAKA